jgi:hypothetical protein
MTTCFRPDRCGEPIVRWSESARKECPLPVRASSSCLLRVLDRSETLARSRSDCRSGIAVPPNLNRHHRHAQSCISPYCACRCKCRAFDKDSPDRAARYAFQVTAGVPGVHIARSHKTGKAGVTSNPVRGRLPERGRWSSEPVRQVRQRAESGRLVGNELSGKQSRQQMPPPCIRSSWLASVSKSLCAKTCGSFRSWRSYSCSSRS